ncbi:hypothetical protein NJT12_03405 [Flavobacterium sp. AC]|uniref:Uncharacterized protein n=1 Tax=Flavobacterium azizsancarii TaxID=2961580 RepID=A0ABT4W7Z2_9FLAO|nr:hypothetical protein [Flavobacterium azizsancarii]MDA6068658.1 hypothetical protein [Flavobacterium azizsancarii]
MKIDIVTTNAKVLNDKIFKAVGKELETWEARNVAHTGKRFITPIAQQYADVVILHFEVNDNNDRLRVTPHYWEGKDEPTDALFAIVMGMFTAAILTHFSDDFSKLETTT